MFNINFDDIDIYDIASWPLLLKLLVLVGICSLTLILCKWVLIDSKVRELTMLVDEERKLRDFFAKKQRLLVNIDEYKDQMIEIEQRLDNLIELLPSNNKMPDLVNQISEAGRDSKLEIKEVIILPEKKLKYYSELPIKIKVYGGYHQIGEFVSKISGSARIITFHDLSIKALKEKDKKLLIKNKKLKIANKNELLELEILTKTFRYNGEALDNKNTKQKERKV